jgi:hypothetical protein
MDAKCRPISLEPCISIFNRRQLNKSNARIVLAISMSLRARGVAVSEIALLGEFHGCS